MHSSTVMACLPMCEASACGGLAATVICASRGLVRWLSSCAPLANASHCARFILVGHRRAQVAGATFELWLEMPSWENSIGAGCVHHGGGRKIADIGAYAPQKF